MQEFLVGHNKLVFFNDEGEVVVLESEQERAYVQMGKMRSRTKFQIEHITSLAKDGGYIKYMRLVGDDSFFYVGLSGNATFEGCVLEEVIAITREKTVMKIGEKEYPTTDLVIHLTGRNLLILSYLEEYQKEE